MVEAAHRSGARSVLSWAARLGRPAWQYRGRSPATSALPHALILSGGAVLVTDAADVLSTLTPAKEAS